MELSRLSDVLLDPFVDPASRTFWGGLVVAALVALGIEASRGRVRWRAAWAVLRHPSTGLDAQLFVGRQLLRALGALPVVGGGWWLATRLVRWLDATVGVPEVALPTWVVTVAYTGALFVAWDLSRYVLHRLMHEIPALWAFHQVHHSAEVLTPLTFHRIHPVESLLYGARGFLVTGVVTGGFFWAFRGQATEWTLFGVHGVGFLLNLVAGNLRHSHVWWSFGPLERWLLSPAQHQVHHALGLDRFNYGTWLAVWDRWGGSWRAAGPTAPAQFGLSSRNHGDDLLSAWAGPFHHVARRAVAATQARDECS